MTTAAAEKLVSDLDLAKDDKGREEEKEEEPKAKMSTKRMVRFQDVPSLVVEIPLLDDGIKQKLFYSAEDVARFQQDEQQRYQQHLMQMALFTLADKLQEMAVEGASQEEIQGVIVEEMNRTAKEEQESSSNDRNAFMNIANKESVSSSKKEMDK